MRKAIGAGLAMCLALGGAAVAAEDQPHARTAGVRGFVTRAEGKIAVDGKLDEWSRAFCTPIAYNHKDPANRASQFFYQWDDEALYIGLRSLDKKQANPSPIGGLFNGDAVEFYIDARPDDAFRGKEWSPGAVHMYFTAFDKDKIGPRWSVRKGTASGNPELKGVEVAATATDSSYDLEFKLPWANFPGFSAVPGAVLSLDAELCFSDGAARVDRTFAYGSPLSVQQPASQAKVKLVPSLRQALATESTPAVQASLYPMWVETPWVQPERARSRAVVAIPPTQVGAVGPVEIRIHGLDGGIVRTIPATIERFGPEGLKFARAVASWPIDDFAPGTFLATARILDPAGSTVATIAPRLVHEGIMPGR
ncbi:sugar-binding protein [Tundrisphaera sp. TA3]|uniref:sugar-binding protein n=1 Tax=Tundrisphaera sp. TA3 TaxID=3435775 RepID=UPI003EBCA70C